MHQHLEQPRDRRASTLRYPTYNVTPTEADSLALALRGLPVAARALMVGIHPDDEDSALLAELALRYGVRTVYLSLTRGEGGQNRIGPESGTALGILRAGELLAARRYDGAEQIFAPYIDFGYARDAEASFAQWGREHMIGSVVQAIRDLQPDIVISVWTGTAADGHGHHQACGIATHEAFERAADTTAFPEQLQAGLTPWQPRRLLVRVRDVSRQRAGDLHIDTGRWDPVLGRSCFEIAMQGRSLHRCQNMGALQTKGTQHITYRVVAGAPVQDAQDGNPVADLPIRLDAWVRTHLGDEQNESLAAIETATQQLQAAWDTFHPQRPEQAAPILLNALRQLKHAMQLLGHPRHDLSPAHLAALRDRIQERIGDITSAWQQTCGVALEVLALQPQVTAGETFTAAAELFMRGHDAPTLQTVDIHPQPGWQVERLTEPTLPISLSAGDAVQIQFRVTAPDDEETAVDATLVPWLRLPSSGYLYRFPSRLPSLAPCAPPLLTVEAVLQAGDLQLPIAAPLVYREADPGLGEIRQPVRVMPSVTVEVAPSLIVLQECTAGVPTVTVKLHAQRAERGRLVLQEIDNEAPARRELGDIDLAAMTHHTIHQELPRDLDLRGKRTFRLLWERLPASPVNDKVTVYHNTLQDVRYPHIEPGYLLTPAQLAISIVPVEVAPDLTIGYVPGTGDIIPQALATLGVSVETVDDTRLQFGDLQAFDAIIVGVRALETRPLVAAHRERLWQYTRAGGTIIVQYQKPREDGPTRFIPFDDISMERPVPRVSQKNAPVRLLTPDDALLTYPNRIGAEDFADWVQERGLYFLPTWPPEMRPLLESADQRDMPRRGGLMRARLGAGHYVYCAYALFRQLPAGVPGAYRLLANLVSLPRSPVAGDAACTSQLPLS